MTENGLNSTNGSLKDSLRVEREFRNYLYELLLNSNENKSLYPYVLPLFQSEYNKKIAIKKPKYNFEDILILFKKEDLVIPVEHMLTNIEKKQFIFSLLGNEFDEIKNKINEINVPLEMFYSFAHTLTYFQYIKEENFNLEKRIESQLKNSDHFLYSNTLNTTESFKKIKNRSKTSLSRIKTVKRHSKSSLLKDDDINLDSIKQENEIHLLLSQYKNNISIVKHSINNLNEEISFYQNELNKNDKRQVDSFNLSQLSKIKSHVYNSVLTIQNLKQSFK